MTGRNASHPRGTGTKFKTWNASKKKTRCPRSRSSSKKMTREGMQESVMETGSEYEDTVAEEDGIRKHLDKYYGGEPWKSTVEDSESDCSGVLSEPGKVERVGSARIKRNKITCSDENINATNNKKSRKETTEHYTGENETMLTNTNILADGDAEANEELNHHQTTVTLTAVSLNTTNNENTISNEINRDTHDPFTNTDTETTENRSGPSRPTKTLSAKINLNSNEYLSQTSQTPNKVYINSTNPTQKLSKFSPFRIIKEIKALCGDVDNIEHTQSGSLLVTTRSHEQTKTLLAAKKFEEANIPIKTTIAWSRKLCQGKIYAPAFSGESLDYLLDKLKPCGVVGIRKLFFDPKKSKIPLYVLTFLGDTPPTEIFAEYLKINVDIYYPSPMRCNKCCRWGHSTSSCHSLDSYCSHCAKKGHSHANCTEPDPTCINCKGKHNALSKECPNYLKELQACTLTAEEGISFREARERVYRQTPTNRTENEQFNLSSHEFPLPEVRNTRGEKSSTSNKTPSNTNYLLTPNRTTQKTQNSNVQRNTYSQTLNEQTSQKNYAHTRSKPIQTQLTVQTSPSSSIITPAQRQRTDKLPENNNQWSTPFTQTIEDNLPTLLPQTQPDNSPIYNTNENQNTLDNMKELIITLLPTLLKLLLAQNFTEKIECFVELGHKLNAETHITKLLQSMSGVCTQNSL